jgi:hypothetical protein
LLRFAAMTVELTQQLLGIALVEFHDVGSR